MTPQDKIARGKRAAEILEDPLVSEALDALDSFVIDGFRGSKVGQRDEREALYFLSVAIADFKAHFRSLLQDGMFAEDAEAKAAAEE
jgi:hypothetical protein